MIEVDLFISIPVVDMYVSGIGHPFISKPPGHTVLLTGGGVGQAT